jgi:AraC-like DNA-binding protein
MDCQGQEFGQKSGHLMLITPERVFYAGLLGRPRQRCSGAFHIYVAIEGGLSLTAGNRESHGELLVVPPDIRHSLAERVSGPERTGFARRIRQAYVELLRRECRDGIGCDEFDAMCFGETLPRRVLDPRVMGAIAQIGRFSGEPVTAASCAAEAGLSTSRFLHLFKQETGISFRAFRAWKRARHLLHFANQDLNLAHLAQDIGYPDSTHFSHSIRRFYGLKPRAIFSGSRDLAIYRSGRTAADSAWTQEAG